MNKKQKKTLRVIGILCIIIVLFLIIQFSQTIFYGVTDIKCIKGADSTYLDCTFEGADASGGDDIAVGQIQEIMAFNRDNFDIYERLLLQDTTANNFFNTYTTKCYANGDRVWYLDTMGGAEQQTLKTSILSLDRVILGDGVSGNLCGQTDMYLLNKYTIINNLFKNQLMVIYGVSSDQAYPLESNNQEQIKTYALCDLSTGACNIKNPKSIYNNNYIVITGAKIYPKMGGYNEENICVENGIESCKDQELFVCDNYQLINRGKVDGKCGNNDIDDTPLQPSINLEYIIVIVIILSLIILTFLVIKRSIKK